MSTCTNEKTLKDADACCKSTTKDQGSYCTAYNEGQTAVCHGYSDKCSWGGKPPPSPPSPSPPSPPPSPPKTCINSKNLQEATQCCQNKTNDKSSYCTAYDEGQTAVCHGYKDQCSWGGKSPPSPKPPSPKPPSPKPPSPKPPSPKPPSPKADWCGKQWASIGGDSQYYTSCNAVGLCTAPHGLACCTPSYKNISNPSYPCKDKMGDFCAKYVNGVISNMKDTSCPVSFYKCDYDNSGKCITCDPKKDADCLASQFTTKTSCKNNGCFKIPNVTCNGGPAKKWSLDNISDNANYLTIWAEGAGGLGEGSTGNSPKLVQYYRGMADFFCKQYLPANRLQLRIENPYKEGTPDASGLITPDNSIKNMYYPSVNSPIYKDLLSNLPKNVTVQFMPWTHEPWRAFAYEIANNTDLVANIPVNNSCSISSKPCYGDKGKSIFGPTPSCASGDTTMNGDCYSMSSGKCVNHANKSLCLSGEICAKKTGQKWPSCITKCCDGDNATAKVCSGTTVCCSGDSDCPIVPALAVLLTYMWNKFLQQQSGYTGPFITGLAFDAEGSGYASQDLAYYSRKTLYVLNGEKDYMNMIINNTMQRFVISVTQGSSFGGLIQKVLGCDLTGIPIVDNRNKKAFTTTLPNDMAGIKTRLLQVLKTGNESDKDAPSLADEALPEYYNVIDECGKLGGSAGTNKPNYTMVDSLPNWKYPDFRATKKCGVNFVPYVGENKYLTQRKFKCGDPKIMKSTDCSGSGPSPIIENFNDHASCPQMNIQKGKFPCCGCGYSPDSIYLTSVTAAKKLGKTPTQILWDGVANDTVFTTASKRLNGKGPLQFFVTDAMKKNNNSANNKAVMQFGVSRTCALLSCETSHGTGKTNCLYPIYPAKNTNDMTANCGIPNAFGVWEKKDFIDISHAVFKGPQKILGTTFGSVGLFSYPLIPKSWMQNSPYLPQINDLGGSEKTTFASILPYVITTLLCLGALLFVIFGIHKHKIMKEVLIAALIIGIAILTYFLIKSFKK